LGRLALYFFEKQLPAFVGEGHADEVSANFFQILKKGYALQIRLEGSDSVEAFVEFFGVTHVQSRRSVTEHGFEIKIAVFFDWQNLRPEQGTDHFAPEFERNCKNQKSGVADVNKWDFAAKQPVFNVSVSLTAPGAATFSSSDDAARSVEIVSLADDLAGRGAQ